MNKKYAIAITAYSHFEIFEESLNTIKSNDFTKNCDVFVYIDRYIDEPQLEEKLKNLVYIDRNIDELQRQEKLKNLVLGILPNATVVLRQRRYGADLNTILALDETFKRGYDYVFLSEDDVVYNSTAFETMANAMEWVEKRQDNWKSKVGIIQSWNYNLDNKPELKEQVDNYYRLHGLQNLRFTFSPDSENELAVTGQNFWGCLISKKMWDEISNDILNTFHDVILYNLVENYSSPNIYSKIKDIYSESLNASDEFIHRQISRYTPISWESNIDLYMLKYNWFKLALTNPRSTTIGKSGLTSTNNMYDSCGLNQIILSNSDSAPDDFIINSESVAKFTKHKDSMF